MDITAFASSLLIIATTSFIKSLLLFYHNLKLLFSVTIEKIVVYKLIVTLAEEWKYTRAYLEIMQYRFGKRLHCEFALQVN
ncbi:MAG: histidine kinase, partial [Clostridia bacterium]|nr:histidine kinase [Clostridia bacterium]